MENTMNKLEISFNSRTPYDDETDSRSSTIDFTTNSLGEVVRQFNKFLLLNDFEAQVEIKCG
jgi:hypothetical protein